MAMSNVLDDMLLPAIAENINPERVYRFDHPTFEGNGCQAYRTLLIVPNAESRARFDTLEAEVAKLNPEQYGYLCCFQKPPTLDEALARGHLFYSLVCQPKNLVHAVAADGGLPVSKAVLLKLKEKAGKDMAVAMPRITAFMDGTGFYRVAGDLPMATFMLQQVIELTFRLIESVFSRSSRHTHLIRAHLNRCRVFTPELCALFPSDTEEDRKLIFLLDQAYVNVRYREGFVIEPGQLNTLFTRAEKLLERTPLLITAHLEELDAMIEDQPPEGCKALTVSENNTNQSITMNLLSQKQRKELDEFALLLQSKFSLSKVFCFGYRAPAAPADSCFGPERIAGSADHYDLLVAATVPEETVPEIEQFIYDLPMEEYSVTAVVHTEVSASTALEKGDRFFATVYSEGFPVFTYDPWVVPDWMTEIDWPKAYEQAARYWKVREERATSLLSAAAGCIEGRHYETAAFLSGQCLEQVCTGMILTFLGYRAGTRNLSKLLNLCANFSSLPTCFFPRNTEEEQCLFRLLSKAATDFRYRESEQVSPEEAQLLFEKVAEYTEKADKFCRRKLAALAEKAGMPTPPDPLEELLREADEEVTNQ